MIVIPMAGLSRRFTEAGYDRPKFRLPLDGGTVFDAAVGSFRAQFATHDFLFIARETGADTAAFIADRAAALGLASHRVAMLDRETAGQAETVEWGLDRAEVGDAVPITIFNIDTFRPNYREPAADRMALAGWLEVFEGEGANWSYVRPADHGIRIAAETAEKRPISDLCCTGLYHFARAGDFRSALAAERLAPQAPELYVAPLYNHLIAGGGTVGYELIARDAVIFCGTPDEYRALGGPPPA